MFSCQDSVIHRSVKPHILSTIGDIALAIGPSFKEFLNVVFGILQQVVELQKQVDKVSATPPATPPQVVPHTLQQDFDMIDYINELRDGCLEAYTGIIQGLKGDNEKQVNRKADLLLLPPLAALR